MVTKKALSFEQLNLGDRWTSQEREILASDIHGFAELTGDNDPLHTDPEYAADGPFRKPIAHGLLGISILAGLSSNAPNVQTTALVNIRTWNFCKPVYVGDSVHAITEVIDLKPRGRRHGEVHWYRQLINQDGERVQEGILVTLVARREPVPSKRAAINSMEESLESSQSLISVVK